ncbi:unnamed protein product [Closterium sp. Naga37s-1]|nr:unnamed protein product [Closterium sp. Naga37s-1]
MAKSRFAYVFIVHSSSLVGGSFLVRAGVRVDAGWEIEGGGRGRGGGEGGEGGGGGRVGGEGGEGKGRGESGRGGGRGGGEGGEGEGRGESGRGGERGEGEGGEWEGRGERGRGGLKPSASSPPLLLRAPLALHSAPHFHLFLSPPPFQLRPAIVAAQSLRFSRTPSFCPLPPPLPFPLSSFLRPAIVAAQALRFSRTPHDLLLLLSSSVPRQPSTLPLPLLLRHFTAVIPLPANHLQGAAVAANPLLVANPGGGGVAGWGGSGGGAGGAAGDGLGTNQGAGMAGGGSPVEGYRKLHVWRLVEYEWVLYLDVDVLITRNLDHLFPSNADNGSSTFSSNSSISGGGGSSSSSSSSSSGMSNKGAGRVEPSDSPSPDTTSPHRQPCPEPLAAAPDVYEADRFNAGVLLVRPSLAVFRQIVRRAKVVAVAVAARAGAMPNDQDFLNSVFRHWFQSHPSCRLPFTSNAILHFPLPWYQPPSWLHPPCGPDCAPLHLGPVHTVHFANPWFKPWLFLNTPLDQLIPGSQELGFKGAGNRVAAGSAASNAAAGAAAGAAGSAATGAATAVAAGSAAAATTSNSSSCACGWAGAREGRGGGIGGHGGGEGGENSGREERGERGGEGAIGEGVEGLGS